MLNAMAKPNNINNVFNVRVALKLLFGKNLTIKSTVNRFGSSFGSPKAIQSVNCPNYRATALQNLKGSRITGSAKNPKKLLTMHDINIFSSTGLTSIKMGVS